MLLLLLLLLLLACFDGDGGGDWLGPDVSHWQGTIDWHQVKSGGYGFAIAKATEGTKGTDSQFKTNWKVCGT